MLARVRARLTYANVVATLALFVALGGSAYASHLITSADVKNRSLKGGDLKLNTITGREIREARLGEVPNSRASQTAVNALSAASAANADTANNANTANNAGNANALGGQGAGAFEKSSRTQFGRAPATPAGPPTEQVLFSWPELGVEVRSSSQACGGDAQFAVRNTKGAGDLQIVNGNQPADSVGPGGVHRECSPEQDAVEAELTDASGRTMFVDCIEAQGEIRCIGIRSEP